MTREKPVSLKLEGGLGNQLFEMAAGYFLAAKLDTDLYIDQYLVPLTTFHGETGSGYEPFEPLKLPNSRKVQFLPELPGKVIVGLAKKSKSFKRIVIKKRMLTSNPFKLDLFLETNDVNSMTEFFNIVEPMKLHGNFQSWEIVERASWFGFPRILQLRNSPSWIRGLEEEIDFRESIAVHFRVGNDTSMNDKFKQPNIAYYLAAVNKLMSKGKFSNAYILSDDLKKVRSLFGSKLDKGFEYLEMPSESSPAERLYVLSLFGGIICANSTFCGWAAWSIYNSGGEVVVPVPYSDGPILGSRDFPSNWIKLDKYTGKRVP